MRLLVVACLGLVVLLMVTSGAAGKTYLVETEDASRDVKDYWDYSPENKRGIITISAFT